jgi:hypothetical protein
MCKLQEGCIENQRALITRHGSTQLLHNLRTEEVNINDINDVEECARN